MKLDHCVLPTAGLAGARERLEAMGFTVAPDAAHPFGTANCCVFFRDGSYLEPLAVADEEAAREAARRRNTFVSRDHAFREACGEEGFSAVVLSSDDADADHARFVRESLTAGPPLSFSRPFVDPDGTRAQASFKLAFAAPRSSPSLFFTVERVKMPAVSRSSLKDHGNGAVGIRRIVATAGAAGAAGNFFDRLLQAEGDREAGVWSLSSAVLSLFSPEHAEHTYGIEADDDERLRLRGIVFRVPSIGRITKRLTVAKIAHTVHRDRLVVPPGPGQGAYFIFEESRASTIGVFFGLLLGGIP